jgi:hypothetical protein
MKLKKIKTASLYNPEIDLQEKAMTRALTPGERIAVCFELSNFCMEINRAARRHRKIHQRKPEKRRHTEKA